jgi:type VI secretion system protein ImpL
MVAARIRERMIQYSASPEKLFEYFKAYLMLGEPRKLDKDHVKALADAEWGPPAKTALTRHFHHLVDTTDTPRPLPLDGTLVAQARSSLSRTSVPKMVYDSVKREYAADPTLGLRIDQAVGLDVERVFRRRSGTPLSKPIPRLYTRDAFREITGVQGRAALLGYLQKDAWIWGEGMATSLATGGSQLAAVTALYEEDYIREWNALLDDLEFVFPPSVAETNEALRILTSPTSPLTGILRVIGDQTALVETKQASGSGGIIDNATKSVTDKLSKAFKPFQTATGAPTREPGMAVTTQFRWVRQLMSGEAGKTQLDAILQTLSEIQKQFDALGPDVAGQRPAQVLANPSFRTLLQQLRHQTSALPTGLRILVEQIAEMPEGIIIDAATKELEGLYDAQVVPRCRALIENHYPFGSTAMPDVKLDDFGMVFGHDGVFDKFFNEQMAKLVDASRSPWTWLPGGARPSRNILGQFETARRLRDMFFSPGMKLPQVKFGVTITDLDPTTSRFVLQIDGQNSQGHYQKPPVRYPVEWPGKTSGQAAASFEGRFYDPEAKNIGGPWAWFRLIDETMEGAPDAQQRIRLKVQNRHNQRAFVTVDAERAQGNPFATRDWRSFNCEP